jgi:hypothetical protein
MGGVRRLKDRQYAAERAYVPEHMTDYVRAVSGAEAYISGTFIFYVQDGYLAFIGYPLEGVFQPELAQRALDRAIGEIKPSVVSVIAPQNMEVRGDFEEGGSDDYFRLPAQETSRPSKVMNVIRRADRELSIRVTRRWTDAHQNLLASFLGSHSLDEATQSIYVRVPDYVALSPKATIVNALNREGSLVAFDVAEFGARQYAFYMFNFRSAEDQVPGVSDLLLHAIMGFASEQGKKYVNLGLGVNAGVRFFKAKWGAERFLRHKYGRWRTGRSVVIQDLFSKL